MQFEGGHKQIVLRGIERAGQDTMIQDGAMNEVIGLDMRDGSYVPYAPTSESVSLPKDTILIRHHHTSIGNNLIAVDKNLSLFFKKENNEAWQYVCQLPSAEIAMLGNAICTTESGFYLLWQYSKYKVIKRNNYPKVLLRAHDSANNPFYVTGEWTDENRYKAVSKNCDDAGYLHQMHLCRYAIELTNGSYCYVSAPFLIQHPHARINRNVIRNGGAGGYNSINAPYYEEGRLWWTQLQYRLEEDFNAEEVLRVSVFLTRGFDMFNMSRITNNYPTWDNDYYDSLLNGLQGEDIYYKVYDIYPKDLKATDEWNGISLAGRLGDNLMLQDNLPVTSSDTYLAEQLFVYNSRLHMLNVKRRVDADYRIDDFLYRASGTSDFSDSFVTASSAGISDYGNLTSIRIDGQIGQGNNYWLNVNRMYSSSDISNGVLDLGKPVRGSVMIYFADSTTYSATATGETLLDVLNTATGNSVLLSPYKITIWYKSASGEEVVSVHSGYYYRSTLYKVNPYIAVCNKNATRIMIEIQFSGVMYKIDKSLVPSATQNVAYCLDDDFMPMSWQVGGGSFSQYSPKSSDEITHMVVSETNMPDVFNLEAYRVGTSRKVVGVSFYSFDVTSDNFGNYPLVVFTEDGVYLLRIEESGAYAYRRIDKVSEDVCTNRGTICRTNVGILFGTEKGLMVLANGGVQESLHHLIGEPKHVARNDDSKGHGLYVFYCAVTEDRNQGKIADLFEQLSQEDLRELIQSDCHIEYDKHIGKLVIWSNSIGYAYMIDVTTGLTTKIHVVIMLSDKEGGYYGDN